MQYDSSCIPVLAVISTHPCSPCAPSQDPSVTHWVEQDSEEEFPSVDDFIKLLGTPRVLVIEDGVCEQAAGLPWENLEGENAERLETVSKKNVCMEERYNNMCHM